MSPRWISLTAAAMRLRITYAGVRNLICLGRLKGRQVAGRYTTWLVDRADVERLARERRRAAQ